MKRDYDAIVVGGGMAGLTSASYLCQSGVNVLLCEKEEKLGGLVSSFDYKGFTFDGGIRAIENSGIVLPMLKQLGININFQKNEVSIGIEEDIVHLYSETSLSDYQELLNRQFPQAFHDINKIIFEIKKIMRYMEVLYGIDNPLFSDLMKDKDYLYKTILPWLIKFIFTINKIQKLSLPVDEYLHFFTSNQVLIDMIAQHFFQKTPTFFALSYFSLYLDYQYPLGGTGTLVKELELYIRSNKGTILNNTIVSQIYPAEHLAIDKQGNKYYYKQLIWAADMKTLYQTLNLTGIFRQRILKQINQQRDKISDKQGGDSIFTVYLTVNLDVSYFENTCSPHLFYTPEKKGLSNIPLSSIKINSVKGTTEFIEDKEAIINWISRYLCLTTYEISFPVMRNRDLAPFGKTGIIISTLFDYSLVEHMNNLNMYDEFKVICEKKIIELLDSSVFPGLKANTIDHFSSTPLTIAQKSGNADGAITGWAFTNKSIPAVNRLSKVAKSVITPIPDISQAGQWTYSPAGLPISILTGKLAANRVIKKLKD
jgi:phytoene dehydrogenase-like protein